MVSISWTSPTLTSKHYPNHDQGVTVEAQLANDDSHLAVYKVNFLFILTQLTINKSICSVQGRLFIECDRPHPHCDKDEFSPFSIQTQICPGFDGPSLKLGSFSDRFQPLPLILQSNQKI